MGNALTPDLKVCPFCHNELSEEDPCHCMKCGAEMMKAHINRTQKKRILFLRTILLIVSSLTFAYFYPLWDGGELLIASFCLAITFSLLFPYAYFKILSRNNNVWIRRPLHW